MRLFMARHLLHTEPALSRKGLALPGASTMLESGSSTKELTMSMQSLTKLNCFINHQFVLAPGSPAGNAPTQASSRDYSFDFDEDELAGLQARVPTSVLDRPIPTVEADEFERLYHWFNS